MLRNEPTENPDPRILPAYLPALLAVAVIVAGVLTAPHTCLLSDVPLSFLPWARASGGVHPWDIYSGRPDCNYPPLFLYVLTVVEALRRAFGAGTEGAVAFMLLKLPSILAYAGGILLCEYGLRKPLGVPAARRAAVAWALCGPLFVNAAAWGQADAPLSFLMAAAVIAALGGRPAWTGAALGAALAFKLQAIVIVPALAIYFLRRNSGHSDKKSGGSALSDIAIATAAGAAVMAIAIAPFVLHGTGAELRAAYTGAVGMFSVRTSGAYNLWHLTLLFDMAARHMAIGAANSDTLPILGPITPKMIGLTLFAACLIAILRRLWHRPGDSLTLIWSASLSGFAFFMLCTEMHERYVIPALALLALAAGLSVHARRIYAAFDVTITINQILAMIYFNRVVLGTAETQPLHDRHLFTAMTAVIAIAQTLLFGAALLRFSRDTRRGTQF